MMQNAEAKPWNPTLLAVGCGRFLYKWSFFMLLFVCLMLTLLWDMQSLHSLSISIHDDHSSFWVDLRPHQMDQWYTPLDKCLLSINESSKAKMSNCLNKASQGPKIPLGRFCAVGRSFDKVCAPPFRGKAYLWKQLNPHMYQSYSRTKLVSTLKQMAEQQKILFFVGDSLAKQNMQALLCEVAKHEPVPISGDFKLGSNFTIHWKRKLRIVYYRLSLLDSPASSLAGITNVGTDDDMTQFDALKAYIRSIHLNIVFIVSFGSSYIDRIEFRTDVDRLFRYFDGLPHTVYVREAAAQHWDHTAHGYLSPDYLPETGWVNSSGECVPLNDASHESDWRNFEIHSCLTRNEYNHIRIIPFRDVTAPLYNMHINTNSTRDCANYCYFPQLWVLVWHSLSGKSVNMSSHAHFRSSGNDAMAIDVT